jgi:hypothetical protein
MNPTAPAQYLLMDSLLRPAITIQLKVARLDPCLGERSKTVWRQPVPPFSEICFAGETHDIANPDISHLPLSLRALFACVRNHDFDRCRMRTSLPQFRRAVARARFARAYCVSGIPRNCRSVGTAVEWRSHDARRRQHPRTTRPGRTGASARSIGEENSRAGRLRARLGLRSVGARAYFPRSCRGVGNAPFFDARRVARPTRLCFGRAPALGRFRTRWNGSSGGIGPK